jgi:hypothetical protein
MALLELLQQLHGPSIAARRKSLRSTSRIHSDRPQELAELLGRARIEPTMGAFSQPRNLAEYWGRLWVFSFLKQKYGQAKLAGGGVEVSRCFFHRIAHEDQRLYSLPRVLRPRMGEYPTQVGCRDPVASIAKIKRPRPPEVRATSSARALARNASISADLPVGAEVRPDSFVIISAPCDGPRQSCDGPRLRYGDDLSRL